MRWFAIPGSVGAGLFVLACSGNPDAQIGAMEGEQNASPTLPAPAASSPSSSGSLSSSGSTDPGDDDAGAPVPTSDGGTTPAVDAGSPGKDAGAAGAAFGAACTKDKDCASGTCFDFTVKGKRCTKACTKDADCASVSALGCATAQKVCRVL